MNVTKKAQQIGFLTALSLVVGTTIGAGIFFKSPGIIKSAQGDLVYVAIAWIVSVIGIISIGICIVELSTASKVDKGPLTWIRNFTPARFSRYSSSFFLFAYLPLTYFALPIYLVQVMVDSIKLANPALGKDPGFIFNNGWFVAFLAFVVFVWLVIGAMISSRFSKGLSWVTTLINFFPLLILSIFAIIAAANIGGVVDRTVPEGIDIITAGNGLTGTNKGLVILFAIPSLLFSFDGFYAITASRSYLKKPSQMPWIIIIGIIIITTLYLFLSISFTIGSINANATSSNLFPEHLKWLQIVLNVLISSAVLGTINGYVFNLERVYVVSAEEGEFNFLFTWEKLLKRFKIKMNRNHYAYLIILLFGFFAFVILTPLSFIIKTDGGKALVGNTNLFQANYIYGAADTFTTYTSLLLFIFIGVAIVGGYINKTKKQIKTKPIIFYRTIAAFAIVFLVFGSGYYFIEQFIDIFFVYDVKSGTISWNNFNIGQFIKNIVLIIILVVSGIIAHLEHNYSKKHHPNILEKEKHINSLFSYKS